MTPFDVIVLCLFAFGGLVVACGIAFSIEACVDCARRRRAATTPIPRPHARLDEERPEVRVD